MKKFKVIMCCLMALVLLAFVGCGDSETPDNPSGGGQNSGSTGTAGTLKVASFEGGYGGTWTKALADAYMDHNPQYKIKVECNPLIRDYAVTATQANSARDADLFFVDGISVGSCLEDYGSLADISALYESTPKAGENEESVKVKDKILPEIAKEMMYKGDQAEFQNKYYLAPSPSGPCSIILNTDALDNVFGKGNWSEPRTSKELIALCDAIVEANAKVNINGANITVYPFIYSGEAVEYWRYMYYPWQAQYDGLDSWNEYIKIQKDGQYSVDAFFPDGKTVALTQFEKIIKRTNYYCDTDSMGAKHNAAQKYFFQGRACMYCCGDWLERELEGSTSYKPNLKMIRTPIISDLAAKLEKTYSVSLGANAAEKDKKLAEIVSAVDEGKDSLEGVSAEVFNYVKTARSYTFTLANNAIGFVIESSKNKDLAIDFLRFMYSDEGAAIVLRESGSYLPLVNAHDIEVDSSDLTTFRRSVNNLQTGAITYMYTSSADPIRYRAGVDLYIGNEKPEVAMGKKTNALTAAEYLKKERSLLESNWANYIKYVS